MIDFYTWTTPNGRKVSIMLEELALPYRVHAINIGKDDQFKPDYLKINPNGKIPSIVDPDGPDGKPISMMESGAILVYLADKTGKLLAKSGRPRAGTLRDRALYEGDAAPLRRARRPSQGQRVSGRRVLHRGHRDLSLGRAPRMAQGGARRFSRGEALVRRDLRAPGGEEGDGCACGEVT